MRKLLFLLCISFSLMGISFAHQPRLVMDAHDTIHVQNPEISQAFYGNLHGQSDVYEITMTTGFHLYVSIVVPDLSGQRTDFVVDIIHDKNPISTRLNGERFTWEPFYEEFAGDAYLNGPEWEKDVTAGTYTIIVTNSDNIGKYSLAIGKIESFSAKEMLHTLKVLPSLKMDFFDKSRLAIFQGLIMKSLAGSIVIIILLVIGVRLLVKKLRR